MLSAADELDGWLNADMPELEPELRECAERLPDVAARALIAALDG